jgi:hypothetical protein
MQKAQSRGKHIKAVPASDRLCNMMRTTTLLGKFTNIPDTRVGKRFLNCTHFDTHRKMHYIQTHSSLICCHQSSHVYMYMRG